MSPKTDTASNTWDGQNRLLQCAKGDTTTSYTYGSDGLRRSMTVQTGTGESATTTKTDYLLDGQNVVQEFSETQGENNTTTLSPIATYLAGPRGMEYRQDVNGVRSWYLYDGLGSVIAEVNEGNDTTPPEITSTRTYDVYGAPRASTVTGTTASHHKFCGGLGHTADDSTGLTYMRARYYDPVIGRFISEDPKQQGSNWYAYCNNNPANLVDPSGACWQAIAAIFLILLLLFFALVVEPKLDDEGQPYNHDQEDPVPKPVTGPLVPTEVPGALAPGHSDNLIIRAVMAIILHEAEVVYCTNEALGG